MSTSRLAFAGMAITAAALLAGCAPHSDPVAVPASHAPSSVTPSSTPTPTPTGLPDDVLLRVTAVATTPDGAAVRITMTASAPTAGDGTEPAAMTAARCDDTDWQKDIPSPRRWIRVSETSTLIAGTAWPGNDQVLMWGGSGWGWAAWRGSWDPFQAYCDFGIPTLPGTAQGVIPVSSTASTTDRASWLFPPWGFDWLVEGDDPATQPFSFTQCSIELGPQAQAYASTLTRTPPIPGYRDDSSCSFGPQYR